MEKTILINKSTNHNKYWIAEYDQTKLTVNWGRIGTKGGKKEYTFSSPAAAKDHYNSQVHKKQLDGYKKVTEHTYNKLTLEANIIGNRNKIILNHWVRIEKRDQQRPLYTPIEERELSNPNQEVGLLTLIALEKAAYEPQLIAYIFDFEKITRITATGLTYDTEEVLERASWRAIQSILNYGAILEPPITNPIIKKIDDKIVDIVANFIS